MEQCLGPFLAVPWFKPTLNTLSLLPPSPGSVTSSSAYAKGHDNYVKMSKINNHSLLPMCGTQELQ